MFKKDIDSNSDSAVIKLLDALPWKYQDDQGRIEEFCALSDAPIWIQVIMKSMLEIKHEETVYRLTIHGMLYRSGAKVPVRKKDPLSTAVFWLDNKLMTLRDINKLNGVES